MPDAPRWPLRPALVFALLFTFVFALHAPLLRLPYFWDEAGHFIPAARDLYLHAQLIPTDTLSNAHPPLVPAWVALWWKLSGFTPAVARTATLVVAAFALLGLFRLALAVSKAQVAVATVLLTALYPVFFAQCSLAHLDLAAAAFTFWALSYYVEERRWMASLMFALAALAKETAIIAPLALLLVNLIPIAAHRILGLGVERRDLRAPTWTMLLSALPLALWFAYHYAHTGYVFGNPEFVRYNVTATLDPLRFVLALAQRLWQLFGHMNLFVLTAAMLAAMFLPPRDGRERIALSHQLTFAVLALAYLVALSLVGGAVLARYMLPVVPLVILLAVSTLWRRVAGWPLAVGAVAAFFVVGWFVPPPYRYAPEDNLGYRDFILLHKRAADFVSERYPGARVLTAWPASDELTKPYLGYVREPVPVVRIENFTLEQIELARRSGAYQVALLFSTKLEPGRRLRWEFWERQQERFFDFHQDLPPQAAAALLGGEIVLLERRGSQWVAVVDMKRAQDVRLR